MKKILLIFILLASVCDASTLAKVLEIKADVDAIKQVLTEKNIPFTNLADIANGLDSKLPVYSGGDGTASDPFQIATASHFLAVGSGDTVAGASGSWDMDKHYKQVADIDLSGVSYTNIADSFTGNYDSNGYTISGALPSGDPRNLEFRISTTSDFLIIGSGDTVEGTSGTWDMNKYYKQVADIDFDGVAFTPVGHVAGTSYTAFTGSYDGNGYKISNVSFAAGSSRYIGLFAVLMGGIVKNLGVDTITISGSEVSYGAIAGSAKEGSSLILRCAVRGGSISSTAGNAIISGLCGSMIRDGSVTIADSYYVGEVLAPNASTRIAGIVSLSPPASGISEATLSNVWASVDFGTKNDTNAVAALVYSSASSGRTTKYTIENSYANDKSTDNLVYNNDSGTHDATVTNSSLLSTADMYKQASYSGWDFTDTWQINEDESYPYFQAPYPVQSPAPAE